jgi:hypothetical protein
MGMSEYSGKYSGGTMGMPAGEKGYGVSEPGTVLTSSESAFSLGTSGLVNEMIACKTVAIE